MLTYSSFSVLNMFMLAVVLQAVSTMAQVETTCRLLQEAPFKPTPSLTQCYKYNTEACCISGHDSEIQAKYAEMLSESCLRKFANLELFFCLGCNPLQFHYIGVDSQGGPTVRICQSFAQKIWNEDFHSCGLKLPVSNPLANATNPTAPWNLTYEPSTTSQVVLPKLVFQNVEQLLNVMKPPYFEAYTFVVTQDGLLNATCFSRAAMSAPRFLTLSAALVVYFMLTI